MNALPIINTKVDLEARHIQDASLHEALLAHPETQPTLPEALFTFRYNEELNREQFRALNYSKAELKYLALSIFMDPCIIKNRHPLIKALSMLLYFCQTGGIFFFTIGFIVDKFPMIGLYLIIPPEVLFVAF